MTKPNVSSVDVMAARQVLYQAIHVPAEVVARLHVSVDEVEERLATVQSIETAMERRRFRRT